MKVGMIRYNKDGNERTDGGSAMEQIRRLDEERAKLIDGAKAEAMAKAEEAIAELRELGFEYELIERRSEGGVTRQMRPARNSAKGTRQRSDKPCAICGFRTEPPHDARAHRSQAQKKAFTEDELAEAGRSKVDEE